MKPIEAGGAVAQEDEQGIQPAVAEIHGVGREAVSVVAVGAGGRARFPAPVPTPVLACSWASWWG